MGPHPPTRQQLPRLLRYLISQRWRLAQHAKAMDQTPAPFLGERGQLFFTAVQAVAHPTARGGHFTVARPPPEHGPGFTAAQPFG